MKLIPKITFVQGRDWHIRATVLLPDGTALDLTGASVEWQLAARWGGTALISKSSASGIAFPDAAGGVFEVHCARAETAGITFTGPAGRLIHEAAVLTAEGFKKTVFRGELLVLPRLVI